MPEKPVKKDIPHLLALRHGKVDGDTGELTEEGRQTLVMARATIDQLVDGAILRVFTTPVEYAKQSLEVLGFSDATEDWDLYFDSGTEPKGEALETMARKFWDAEGPVLLLTHAPVITSFAEVYRHLAGLVPAEPIYPANATIITFHCGQRPKMERHTHELPVRNSRPPFPW